MTVRCYGDRDGWWVSQDGRGARDGRQPQPQHRLSSASPGRHINRGMFHAMWEVRYLAEADDEPGKLPAAERAALYNAVLKLEAIGPDLGYPHTSVVRGAPGLRELRPRTGRSPWRGL